MDHGSLMPIGRRTSDNGVRVRQKRFLRCAAALPYVAGFLTVPAPPAHRTCRSEDTGGGRERPPVLDCLDRHSRGWACARPATLPEVAPVPKSIPAGRLPSRPNMPVAALSGTATRANGRADADEDTGDYHTPAWMHRTRSEPLRESRGGSCLVARGEE